jgi:hypothetical protein
VGGRGGGGGGDLRGLPTLERGVRRIEEGECRSREEGRGRRRSWGVRDERGGGLVSEAVDCLVDGDVAAVAFEEGALAKGLVVDDRHLAMTEGSCTD